MTHVSDVVKFGLRTTSALFICQAAYFDNDLGGLMSTARILRSSASVKRKFHAPSVSVG